MICDFAAIDGYGIDGVSVGTKSAHMCVKTCGSHETTRRSSRFDRRWA